MAQPLFSGIGVALVTLFGEDGCLDAEATAGHAARLVDLGIRAVVVAGTTGEASTLTPEERRELLRAVREAVPPGTGVPVIAGTGAPSARQAATLTRDAKDGGADGVLVLSPPGSSDVLPYYGTVAGAAAGMPVLAYHFPAVSPPGIPVPVLAGLPVQGCKDSSGDADRLLETVDVWDGPLYVGSSSLLSLAGPLGCAGAILALANAEPEGCIAAFAGDPAAQRALAPAHRQSLMRFPGGIKALTAARFATPMGTRLG
jgi:dihydrodipicolinate synthase/N-acetylneuraminate lyase